MPSLVRMSGRTFFTALTLVFLFSFFPVAEAEVPQPAVPFPPSAVEPDNRSMSLDQRLLLDLFRPVVDNFPAERKRQDLTFQNFFTYGWNVGWKEPEEGPEDAPRFRLLRIQRAFWEREVRFVDPYTFGADGGTLDEQEVEMEVELPVSRRFLIEFEPAVTGVRPNGSSWRFASGDFTMIPELMLYETKDISFSSGLSIRTPTGSQSVGSGRTSLTPYLAWWKDLGQRVGLHTFFGTEFPLAGYGPDRPDTTLQYGIALAKTITPKDTPWLGNLTFFAEFNGTTERGDANPSTTATLLPGARWLLFKDFWLAAGYEFPVARTNRLERRVWISIYRDF